MKVRKPKLIAPIDNKEGFRGHIYLQDKHLIMLALILISEDGMACREINTALEKSYDIRLAEAQISIPLRDMTESGWIEKKELEGKDAYERCGGWGVSKLTVYYCTEQGEGVLYDFVERLSPLMQKIREKHDKETAE